MPDEETRPDREEVIEEANPWGRGGTGTVQVETGRGNSVPVSVGAPFTETIERVAETHYGGVYRVYLGTQEIVDSADAPATIEEGMRITLAPYDKVA